MHFLLSPDHESLESYDKDLDLVLKLLGSYWRLASRKGYDPTYYSKKNTLK